MIAKATRRRLSKSVHNSFRFLLNQMPRSRKFYRICNRYANWHDGYNGYDMYYDGEYALLKFALDNINIESPVVLDVGANQGEWSLAAYQINPSIKLHCFEPVSSTFNQLEENLKSYNPILNKFALGNQPTTTEIFSYHNSLMSSLSNWQPHQKHIVETIDITTLDLYAFQHNLSQIDLLKIDTEGHDFFVLQGAETLFRQGKIGLAQFEYGPAFVSSRTFLKDIHDFIQPLPYKMYQILPGGLKYLPKYDFSMDCFKLSYYVILNKALEERYRPYILKS